MNQHAGTEVTQYEGDHALVAAIRRGDQSAVVSLVQVHQTAVFGLCLRMLGHRQDAEDVTQETFIRACRAISGFDAARPLRPWLLGIAANRCRTALSKRKRRPLPLSAASDRPDPRPPSHPLDELAASLEIALLKLRPEYRMVFSLFHEQGMSYEDIGEATGRPVGTVKTWLHRARIELAQLLSPFTSTSTTPANPAPDAAQNTNTKTNITTNIKTLP